MTCLNSSASSTSVFSGTSRLVSSAYFKSKLTTDYGLRLDDNAVHIAVGLRLGANIREPHQYPCGAMTNAKGLHGLSCKGGNSESARYHSPNDLVWHALGKVNISSIKEPSGLSSSDGKRPDGLTLMLWKNGRCVTWDVTVTDTLAQS